MRKFIYLVSILVLFSCSNQPDASDIYSMVLDQYEQKITVYSRGDPSVETLDYKQFEAKYGIRFLSGAHDSQQRANGAEETRNYILSRLNK